MTGIERLRDIADDRYSGGMVHISVQKLREICEQIEGEVDDISGRDSDVLAWVEEHGGLDAVNERTMPEDMSWPFYEDGEPVRLGEHWQQDEYDWSITSIDSIEFAEDGVRFENEYADAFYRYGERVKRPAPPVLDADGVEIHKGDTVWVASNGMGPYIVDRLPIPGETDVLRLVDETGTCWSDSGFGYIASQLTHERPDSWQRLWLDMHPADETECVGLDRDEFVRRAKKLAGVSE